MTRFEFFPSTVRYASVAVLLAVAPMSASAATISSVTVDLSSASPSCGGPFVNYGAGELTVVAVTSGGSSSPCSNSSGLGVKGGLSDFLIDSVDVEGLGFPFIESLSFNFLTGFVNNVSLDVNFEGYSSDDASTILGPVLSVDGTVYDYFDLFDFSGDSPVAVPIVVTGSESINGFFVFAEGDGLSSIKAITFSPVPPVPLPASVLMFLSSFGLLAGLRRRKS